MSLNTIHKMKSKFSRSESWFKDQVIEMSNILSADYTVNSTENTATFAKKVSQSYGGYLVFGVQSGLENDKCSYFFGFGPEAEAHYLYFTQEFFYINTRGEYKFTEFLELAMTGFQKYKETLII